MDAQKSYKLFLLYQKDNNFGVEAMTMISETLKTNSSLTELFLGGYE